LVNTRIGSAASVRRSANSFAESSIRAPSSETLSRHRIDAKLTNLEDALITSAAGAPQDGADARNELRIVKRLAHSMFVSPDSIPNRDLSPELSVSSGLPPG
jgi:hypothetical protein